MLDELQISNKIVGLKQVVRNIEKGNVKNVFLAKDVSPNICDKIVSACSVNNIEIIYVDTMKQLGSICKIDVPAAVAATLKG